MMREERLAALNCYDCGAPFVPERGRFACASESGSGLTILTEEEQMAGEQVALTRRVYLDEGKSQALPAEPKEDGPIAAWLYGAAGALKSRLEAEGLGLKEGEDFEEPQNAREGLAAVDRQRRAEMARSDATMIEPLPIQTSSTPERREFDRKTGGELAIEEDASSVDQADATVTTSDAGPTPATSTAPKASSISSPNPMPTSGGGATPA